MQSISKVAARAKSASTNNWFYREFWNILILSKFSKRTLNEMAKIMNYSKFSIMYSCILQVQNKLKATDLIKDVVIFFNSYSNLKVIMPTIDDIFDAIETIEKEKLDFDDSLVVACMKSNGITELDSLYKHFDNIKGIKKIEL